jgi:hypothetical protein
MKVMAEFGAASGRLVRPGRRECLIVAQERLCPARRRPVVGEFLRELARGTVDRAVSLASV